jgi:hypothetical protein
MSMFATSYSVFLYDGQDAHLSGTYAEIIGRVSNIANMKMVFALNMGDDLGTLLLPARPLYS